ncbi:aryl-sulfate sulfotransferase [Pedosphaera parvula]|uniref:Arylsulfotransferase n=1 Tax=Pedosphaera parvula (strain Ellin514) TaxID=320771 RepID=B9XMF4_PEDPL|nr:aryl-sulfate sulfotransferase [Pedosphaera parvula]EEF58996.1 Arylsulfotransferase [Pedosphaera parvula Ellin514]
MPLCVWSAILTVSTSLQALTIVSPPSFTSAVNAPLAGTLQLTTDQPSRISVSVNEGTNTWTKNFYDYSTVHSMPLLGFKANRTNVITVTVKDRLGNEATAANPLTFITAPLPSDFPTINLLQSNPEKMEPGYTLFRPVNNNDSKGYLTIVNSAAEVVWYSGATSSLDVRQLSNGDLWVPLLTSINEINMLGQTVKTWTLPAGKPYNHESYLTDHGTILYLSDATRVVTSFPTSATITNALTKTTNVWHQPVIELWATNAALANIWQPIDILDPRRISYLTFSSPASAYGVDWMHANAITEDPRDNSLIVSLRHQNAVVKFSRATGQLKWILGTHDNWGPEFQPYLLTPVGEPFEWQYGQHATKITPQGTLLLFDDGNFRGSPFATPPLPDSQNYSRAVEYQIDEERMEVSQVWEYGASPATPIYSVSRGDTEWMNQSGNVLITYADTAYVNNLPCSQYSTNAHMARIQEVTHDAVPEVVFDFAVFDYGNTSSTYKGYACYRANRIRDLYPTKPVTDLSVQYVNSQAQLRFSGDEARLYYISTSTDLVNWTTLGTANSDGEGNFTYLHEQSPDDPFHYYRVLTQ